ncbi:MAG: DNA-directed RNA polymerase subunit delta [Erysipelotrichaceae bacterium]|nr:DNA-directed RNA polymerase subunit delta [Erysipelotrichaceae bacterium]
MKKMLVFQTDFTYKEGAVAAMYGVVKSIDCDIEIITATHEIPQYDTWSASYRLYQYIDFWPKGTIFVSVVDPGVGTSRKACVAKTRNGYYIVTPDNGSLTHVDKYFGIECVREIDETINRLHREDNGAVSIFHGRDLFGYCRARLASGIISYEEVGPEYDVAEIKRHPIAEPTVYQDRIEGMFEINDPNFGNLWTNITLKDFLAFGFKSGDLIHTVIYHNDEVVFDRCIPYFDSFGKAPDKSVMIYNNEINKMGLAEVVGNLTVDYDLGYGSEYRVVFSHE